MKLRSSLLNILWLALALLLLSGQPAQAQSQCGPSLMVAYTGDQTLDVYIFPLSWGPQFGFSVYACPLPPNFFYFNLSFYRQWFSTCSQGGNMLSVVTHIGSIDYPSQINLFTGLYNPFNFQWLQAKYAGFAYALPFPYPPQWEETQNSGGPCGPTQ